MTRMVHFLVDASLPRPTGDVIRAFGHQATDVRDIGMKAADDHDIAEHARNNQLCVITRDQDFGNILDYPPHDYFGIVVIHAPHGATRAVVLSMVEQFLREAAIIQQLTGRLAIVEPARIRLRPPI